MKKMIMCFTVLFSIFAANFTQASTLQNISNASGHVIYDDISHQYWIWDLHAFVNQTAAEQLATIANDYASTDYFGNNTWHMATLAETVSLFSHPALEIELFNPTYTAYHYEVDPAIPQIHWFGRWVGQDTILGINGVMDDAYYLSTGAWSTNPNYAGNTLTDPNAQYANMGAWVTTTAVPEPESYAMLIAGLGLLGFAARRRKQQAT